MRSQIFMRAAVIIASIVLLVTNPRAAAETTVDPVTQTFRDQQILIDSISNTVERIDMGRLLVIRNTIGGVIADIEANRAARRQDITFQTLRLLQNLIIQYRFSKVFFGWSDEDSLMSIVTEENAMDIAKLKALSEKLVADYGFDDSPYTQITANAFRQMQRLLQQLEQLPLDAGLKTQLRALWTPIGDVLSVASEGDRPKTFERAIPLIKKIRALYPMFDSISASQAGFPMIMELLGLNEFCAEFAQID